MAARAASPAGTAATIAPRRRALRSGPPGSALRRAPARILPQQACRSGTGAAAAVASGNRRGPGPRAVLVAAVALLACVPAAAETLVALRTIRAQTVIAPGDVGLAPGVTPGALTRPEQAIGLEARVALYPGRPIHPADLGPPALVERNARVTLVFRSGGLTITAEGRALARAAAGEAVRVMNLASRTTVTGTVEPDGRVAVSALPLP